MADEDQLTTSPALDSEWDIEAQLDKPLQTIDGFGPCFNELGWDSLSALDNEDKEAIFPRALRPRRRRQLQHLSHAFAEAQRLLTVCSGKLAAAWERLVRRTCESRTLPE